MAGLLKCVALLQFFFAAESIFPVGLMYGNNIETISIHMCTFILTNTSTASSLYVVFEVILLPWRSYCLFSVAAQGLITAHFISGEKLRVKVNLSLTASVSPS